MPIRDSRLTDLCAIISTSGLQGTGIYRADDPTWVKFRPPRHFNCRCGTRRLTVAMAAARGIKEAERWLESGQPPLSPEFVTPPNVELPTGWVSAGGDGFQLSFCNGCELTHRAILSLGNFDEEEAILLAWVPFTTKGGKPAAYWDANPKRKLYGKAYAAWAARQGQGGATPTDQGEQTGASPAQPGSKVATPKQRKQPKVPKQPAAASSGQPDDPANPKLTQPAAQVSGELSKIAEQAKADLAEAGHPVNRLKDQMRDFSVGKGLPKVKTIAGAGLNAGDHAAMGRFHARLSKVLALNGNKELSKAQSLAAQYHFGQGAAKKTPAAQPHKPTLPPSNGSKTNPSAPPKRLKTALDSKAVVDWVDGKNKNQKLAIDNDFEISSDKCLADVNKEVGYDAKPKLRSKQDIDKLVADGTHYEVFRGVTGKNFVDQFKTGDLFAGLGIYGNGTYVAKAEHEGDKKYGLDVAASYARVKRKMSKDADPMRAAKGRIMRMAIPKNANIRTHADVEREQIAAIRKLTARFDVTSDPKEKERLQRLSQVYADTGRYATLHGIDAIDVQAKGYMVILNRGIAEVQK